MGKQGSYDSPLRATLKGITDLYGNKKQNLLLPASIDLKGKTVLITGSSAGLGLAAAKRIASAGAKVIMAVRSGIPEKGQEVINASGNKNVSMYHVDLLDFERIKGLIQRLRNDAVKIDILISNAAMVPLKSRKTPQGLEEMFMVNFLAPFYFINQVLDKNLLNKSSAKIIIVSSESHRNAKQFDWDKFGMYEDYGINETVSRYGYYKLFLTTFANELSRRRSDQAQAIPVRVLCPGPVNSSIAREAPGWMQPLLKGVFSLFFRSPKKASDPILYFASEEDSQNPIDYMFLMQKKEMDKNATNESNGKKLWELSEQLINDLGYGNDS